MTMARYRLMAQLGAGADGISYRAAVADEGEGRSLDETVVELRDLSRARADAGRWAQLVRRLRLAARLEHPAVVRVLDPGLDRDPPHVALEWVGGTTLADAAGSSAPMPRAAATELAGSLAAALEEAHRLGLAHGRLGPGQVFLVNGRPRLDFTGIDAGFPVGSPASRALDADCRDPQSDAGGGPAADRAGRPLWPGRAARLAVDGRDRARGPRSLHGRPGFRPDPRGLDPRPARGRPGRSPVGQRGPRAARRAGARAASSISTSQRRPRSTTPATGPAPGSSGSSTTSATMDGPAGRARSSSMRARPGWGPIACWTSWAREARGSSIAPSTRTKA